jgi:hypothetical protein
VSCWLHRRETHCCTFDHKTLRSNLHFGALACGSVEKAKAKQMTMKGGEHISSTAGPAADRSFWQG